MELTIGLLVVLVVALTWVTFIQAREINKSKRYLKELLVRLDPEYKYAYFDDLTKMVKCVQSEVNILNSKVAELEYANSKYIEKLYPEPEEDEDVNDNDKDKLDFEFLDFPCPSDECAVNGNDEAAQWRIGTSSGGVVCIICSSCENVFSLDWLTKAKYRYEIMVDFLQNVQKAIDMHKECDNRREALTKQ